MRRGLRASALCFCVRARIIVRASCLHNLSRSVANIGFELDLLILPPFVVSV